MLSEQEPEERLERPPEIDDGALLRIQQVRPVEKTASPIIDHNLELIATAKSLRPWYVGTVKRTPHELMSGLLDPNGNNACEMLTAFVETVKRFKPGAFPSHCDAVRKLEFTTIQLIRTLMTLIDSPVLVNALKRVGALISTLSDPVNYLLSDHDFNQRLDARLAQKVIAYLAQSGVTFSIHNACKKVCTKSHKADFNWLYDWCHDHERKIRDAVDALRAGK